MIAAADMATVLDEFVERFNRSPELPQMTRGWDRTIEIRATDAGWSSALRVEGGRIRVLRSGHGAVDIHLQGPADTLAEVFRGERSPTEPYLDGTLTVVSTEADLMKLDVFTLMVWGE